MIIACFAAALVAILSLSFIQTKKLKVTRVSAREDRMKSTPIRICLISDLHFPMMFVNEDVVIDRITATPADILIIDGDIIQDRKGKDRAVAFLKKLLEKTGNMPVRIVLGNHDTGKHGFKEPELSKFIREIQSCGENTKVIENETEHLKIQGSDSKIRLVGIGDYRKVSKITAENVYREGLAEADEKDPLVVISHNPDILTYTEDEIKKSGRPNLVLSAHTHGGQFWMPFNLEFLILRGDRLPKKGYKYGLYDYCENCRLFITCGLGESFLPIRLGTTPEIVFIDY